MCVCVLIRIKIHGCKVISGYYFISQRGTQQCKDIIPIFKYRLTDRF